jgi:DNA-binding beta-propeller fold protein YncE
MRPLTVAPLLLSLALASPFSHAQTENPAAAPAPAAAQAEKAPRQVLLYSTRADNKLHVLDATDLSLIASHDLGLGAHELTVSPDHRFAIGTAYGGPGPGHQPADNRLAVLDLKAGKLHRTIALPEMKRPNDAAFMPDGVTAFVTVEAPPRIVRVNADNGEQTTITLEKGTNHMLALSPDAKRLYVAHVMPGGLSMIDTETSKVLSRIDVPTGAEGLAVTRDNARVWVSCNRSDKVVIVDPAAGKIEREIDVQGSPFRLRISPDGKTVAVSCPNAQDVAFIDTANPDNPRRVSVRDAAAGENGPPVAPTSIAFTPDGKHLAAVCMGPQEQVVLIDIAAGKVTARRAADGKQADALATALIQVES